MESENRNEVKQIKLTTSGKEKGKKEKGKNDFGESNNRLLA